MNRSLARRHVTNLDRAWEGAVLCRTRLAAVTAAAPVIKAGPWDVRDVRGQPTHDVDYYAWEAVRVIKIAEKVVAAGLKGKDRVAAALAAFRQAAPGFETFRNQVTHVEDNRGADDIVYFGEAVRLKDDGGVEYVVDPRYEHHDLLAALVTATREALLTLAA